MWDWLCPVRARHPIYHLLPQQKVGVLWLFKAIYYILNVLNYRIAINLFSRYCGSIVGSLPSSHRGTNSSKVKRKGAEKAIKRTITPKTFTRLFLCHFFQSRWRHSPRGSIPSQMTRRWTSGCRWPTWMSTGSKPPTFLWSNNFQLTVPPADWPGHKTLSLTVTPFMKSCKKEDRKLRLTFNYMYEIKLMTKMFVLSINWFRRCSSSSRQCIRKELFCDGRINCALPSSKPLDEASCTRTTTPPESKSAAWKDSSLPTVTGDWQKQMYDSCNNVSFQWLHPHLHTCTFSKLFGQNSEYELCLVLLTSV